MGLVSPLTTPYRWSNGEADRGPPSPPVGSRRAVGPRSEDRMLFKRSLVAVLGLLLVCALAMLAFAFQAGNPQVP